MSEMVRKFVALRKEPRELRRRLLVKHPRARALSIDLSVLVILYLLVRELRLSERRLCLVRPMAFLNLAVVSLVAILVIGGPGASLSLRRTRMVGD